MHALLEQIENSLGSGQYFLSLFAALTIPDIGGSLSSIDGVATGDKYAAWYEQWVRPRLSETLLSNIPPGMRANIPIIENPLGGADCYRFRCSMLHQGRSQHPKSPFERIIFIEPGATSNVIHYQIVGNALCIDLNLFCREMISGAKTWLRQATSDPNYIRNHAQFVRRHPLGMAPYVIGVPVVG